MTSAAGSPAPRSAPRPSAAQDVEVGDRLLLDDVSQAEVTDVRHGFYQLPEGRTLGVAIGWKSGDRKSGLLFRKGTDLLARAAADQ